ncbi:hypothetical protein U1Q18_052145 [Sarracenia purpurea var. burkii]
MIAIVPSVRALHKPFVPSIDPTAPPVPTGQRKDRAHGMLWPEATTESQPEAATTQVPCSGLGNVSCFLDAIARPSSSVWSLTEDLLIPWQSVRSLHDEATSRFIDM